MHLFSKGSDYELVDMGTFAGGGGGGGGGGIPGTPSLCMKPRLYIYILEDLCNYVHPFLKIPLLDFDQTFRDGGDPP